MTTKIWGWSFENKLQKRELGNFWIFRDGKFDQTDYDMAANQASRGIKMDFIELKFGKNEI